MVSRDLIEAVRGVCASRRRVSPSWIQTELWAWRSGRVGGGKMPRKGKGEWGHSRRGCSITLLPFMLWDRGSFAQFGVTAAVFAVVEPEFELSAALGNRKPHSLS